MALDQVEIDWRSVLRLHGGGLLIAASRPSRVAQHCVGFAYLAVAYDREVRIRKDWRIERSTQQSVLAARELSLLYAAGVTAVCPTIQRAEILHAASTLAHKIDPFDTAFWGERSLPLLNVASIVVVPDVQGWNLCPMVWRDVSIALRHNVPVHLYAGAA